MNHDVKVEPDPDLPPCSRLWMGYFLFTIFFIGFPICSTIYIPLYFLSFIYPHTQKPADWILRWGIGWLMRVQPWLDGEFDLQVPEGGVLLISNHRSHLDAFLLLSRVRGIRILAKQTLFYIPFLGLMMKVTGQIPTRRGQVNSFWQAMKVISEKLKGGQTVHVFPEMTRCEPGFRGTQNFMTAPFLMAMESGRPVLPIVFENTDLVWPKGIFGIRPAQKIRARSLALIQPHDYPSAEALCAETRRRITEAMT